MGNTAYFELCETSFQMRCPDCAWNWEAGIIYWACGKCMQPTDRNRQFNKARYDVLSIPGYVIKKNPTHGARQGPSMRQCMCCKAHDMLRKAQKNKSGGYKNHKKTISTGVICLKLGGMKKLSWPTIDRIRGPLLHCDERGKKSERELMETLIKLRWCKWTIGSARWL